MTKNNECLPQIELKSPEASVFFYGWVIVGISLVGMILIYGIRHSFSVFFPSILDEFGWHRGSTSLMFSLNILVYGLVAPLAGSLGDQWKPKSVMRLGIIILGIATASCAFARSLWHFLLFFGILAPVGSAFSGWPLLAPALANWFAKRRGLAIGLGQLGGGLSFVFGMFIEYVISQYGWRNAYLAIAGALIAVMLPLYSFFHYRPESRGRKAYGAEGIVFSKDSMEELPATTNTKFREWSMFRAMQTYQLWLMVLSYSLYWGFASYLVLAHQVKFAEDVGYSSLFCVSVFALFGVSMAAGQISASLSDAAGREPIITLATVLSVFALLALVFVRDTSKPWLLYLYATFFGYGGGLYSPTLVAGLADIFHSRHFGAIAGLLLTGQGLGAAIGPSLGGFIYDFSGSYISAFVLCIFCFVSACVCVWLAAPRNASSVAVTFRKRSGKDI